MTETQHSDARPQPSGTPVPARGNAAGTTAFVVALVLVTIGIVQQVITPLVPRLVHEAGAGIHETGLVFAAVSLVTGVVALVGVITGVVGIQPSRTRGRLLAAAGLAISASHLLLVLVGFVTSAAFSVL